MHVLPSCEGWVGGAGRGASEAFGVVGPTWRTLAKGVPGVAQASAPGAGADYAASQDRMSFFCHLSTLLPFTLLAFCFVTLQYLTLEARPLRNSPWT